MTKQEIYDIFVDYFKEENVDLQGNNIYVKWDTVTIKNELGNAFKIYGLYCCITLRNYNDVDYCFGNIGFNKQYYSYNEWFNNYIHSHVQTLNKNNPRLFMGCCLGTGPLYVTTSNLRTGMCNDPLKWELFCWELDKYVTVESLSGGPYRRFSSLSITNSNDICSLTLRTLQSYKNFPEVTAFIMKNVTIPFSYSEKQWKLGDTFENIVFRITNEVIRAVNKGILSETTIKTLLKEYMIMDSKIYHKSSRVLESDIPENLTLFNFKDKPVKLTVAKANILRTEVKLLNLDFINDLLTKILLYLNYGYQKDITNDERVYIKI